MSSMLKAYVIGMTLVVSSVVFDVKAKPKPCAKVFL